MVYFISKTGGAYNFSKKKKKKSRKIYLGIEKGREMLENEKPSFLSSQRKAHQTRRVKERNGDRKKSPE
jgi:hypothetical protein